MNILWGNKKAKQCLKGLSTLSIAYFIALAPNLRAETNVPLDAQSQWDMHKEKVEQWQPDWGEVEDWVEAITVKKAVSPSDDALQTLLFDRQIRLESDGSLTQYYHLRQRINNRVGLESAGRLAVTIQPSYETLIFHHYDRERDDVKSTLIDRDKIELLRQEDEIGNSIYHGTLTVTQIFDDLQVGDIVDYSYSVKGRNPILGQAYSDYWRMGWGFDVAQVRLRIVTPEYLKLGVHASESLPEVYIESDKKEKSYTWELENYKAKIVPGDTPPWSFDYPLVEVSEYDNWSAVAQWSHQVFETPLNSQVDWVKANEIINNKQLSKKSKAEKLLDLVQEEVRYFGIETGINALIPSLPNETIQRQYGDCKDKSVLLTQLLRQAGIKADTALVSSSITKGVKERMPGPHVFNHAIVRATIDDRIYWLDPSLSHQGNELPSQGFPDYGYGLLVSAHSNALELIEPPHSLDYRIIVEQVFMTDKDPINMHMTREYRGQFAESIRYGVDSMSKSIWNLEVDSYYQKLYSGLTRVREQHEDSLDSNVYKTQHEYEITEDLMLNGQYWQIELYADLVREQVDIPNYVDREDTLYIGTPASVEQIMIINHQYGILDLDYESVEISGFAFDYRRDIDLTKDKITVQHFLTTKVDAIEPERLAEYVQDLRRVHASLNTVVLLQSPEEQRFEQRNNSLKDRLRKLLKKSS